jgi:hypothetical protein
MASRKSEKHNTSVSHPNSQPTVSSALVCVESVQWLYKIPVDRMDAFFHSKINPLDSTCWLDSTTTVLFCKGIFFSVERQGLNVIEHLVH